MDIDDSIEKGDEIRLHDIFKRIYIIMKTPKYLYLSFILGTVIAISIPISGLYITGLWIYRFSNIDESLTSIEALTSYYLIGVFGAIFKYMREMNTKCKGGLCIGIAGTMLSIVGCCSPIIYILFILGIIGSFIIPYLTLIPIISISLLTLAILILTYRIEVRIRVNTGVPTNQFRIR